MSKNEIFTRVVNNRMSMTALSSSYAAIVLAGLSQAVFFMFAGVALSVGNTSQAYKRALNEEVN